MYLITLLSGFYRFSKQNDCGEIRLALQDVHTFALAYQDLDFFQPFTSLYKSLGLLLILDLPLIISNFH